MDDQVIVGGLDGQLIGRVAATAEAIADGSRRSTVVSLTGPSGTGKTATLRALHDRLRALEPAAEHWAPLTSGEDFLESRKWVVSREDSGLDLRDAASVEIARQWEWVGIECGPDAHGESDPYGVLQQQLDRISLQVADLTLAAPAGSSGSGDTLSEDTPSVDTLRTTRIASDPLAWLRLLADSRPLILAVDDIHCAPQELVAGIRHLLSDCPTLVLTTGWDGDHHSDPLRLEAEPIEGVHHEPIQVDNLADSAVGDYLSKSISGISDGGIRILRRRTQGNPLAIQTLLGTLPIRDAIEFGTPIDEALVQSLPGGSQDDLVDLWRNLPASVSSAVAEANSANFTWLPIAISGITYTAADSVLAEIDGDKPPHTWVSELDEQLAVWVDPALQQVALASGSPIPTDDLIELHRWVVCVALDLAKRWLPNDAAQISAVRDGLTAEGFLPVIRAFASADSPSDLLQHPDEIDHLQDDLGDAKESADSDEGTASDEAADPPSFPSTPQSDFSFDADADRELIESETDPADQSGDQIGALAVEPEAKMAPPEREDAKATPPKSSSTSKLGNKPPAWAAVLSAPSTGQGVIPRLDLGPDTSVGLPEAEEAPVETEEILPEPIPAFEGTQAEEPTLPAEEILLPEDPLGLSTSVDDAVTDLYGVKASTNSTEVDQLMGRAEILVADAAREFGAGSESVMRLQMAMAAQAPRRRDQKKALTRLSSVMALSMFQYGADSIPTLEGRRATARLLIRRGKGSDAVRQADMLVLASDQRFGTGDVAGVEDRVLLAEALLKAGMTVSAEMMLREVVAELAAFGKAAPEDLRQRVDAQLEVVDGGRLSLAGCAPGSSSSR